MFAGEGIVAIDDEGEPRMLLDDEFAPAYPSPNGERIAFYGYRDAEGMRVLEGEIGEKTTLDIPEVSCIAWRPDGQAVAFGNGVDLFFNDLQGNTSVWVDENPTRNILNFINCDVVWVEAK